MTILLTGDTHGDIDMGKLMPRAFDYTGLTKDDYIIILGDFGVVFSNCDEQTGKPAKSETYWLDWLESRPWTTLFVDGNHENHDRLNTAFPVKEWYGGKVHELRPSVLHLMRGEIFMLPECYFLVMGGASSIDRDSRVEGESWWSAEIPNDVERQNCIDNLEEYGWTVDYVLSHDCPINISQELGYRTGMDFIPDEYENWLQFIADKTTFDRWFFGHYHIDMPSLGIGGKYTCLFDQFYDLTNKEWSDRVKDNKPYQFNDFPESKHQLGYTMQEIAELAECKVEDVERIMGRTMYGSSMGYDPETKELLMYRGDLLTRVLPYITNVNTRGWYYR